MNLIIKDVSCDSLFVQSVEVASKKCFTCRQMKDVIFI